MRPVSRRRCPLRVAVLASFPGATLLRAEENTLFASTTYPDRVGGTGPSGAFFDCPSPAGGFTFQWGGYTDPGGALSFAGGTPNFAATPTLIIPPLSLLPSARTGFQTLVSYTGNRDPALSGRAFVPCVTEFSPLVAVVSGGNAAAGNAHPRVLDASASFDPDAQMDDPLLFSWACAVAAEAPGARPTSQCLTARGELLSLPNASVVTLPPLVASRRYFLALTVSKAGSGRATRVTVWLSVRPGALPLVLVEARQPLPPTAAQAKAALSAAILPSSAGRGGASRRSLLGTDDGVTTNWTVVEPVSYASLLSDAEVCSRAFERTCRAHSTHHANAVLATLRVILADS